MPEPMTTPAALREAVDRLRDEMLHAPLCPITPCTCQRFADLALLAAAADAGARAREEAIEERDALRLKLQEAREGCVGLLAIIGLAKEVRLTGDEIVEKLVEALTELGEELRRALPPPEARGDG